MSALSANILTRAVAFRRLRSPQRLLSRCHPRRFHPLECRCGLTPVPVGELTPTSLTLFHSYGAASSSVPVVTDELAFNQILQDVLASDELGVHGVVRDLHRILIQRRRELEPFLPVKRHIDATVDTYYIPFCSFLIFAFLLAQFAVLFHWVFVVFDWNLVEPMTHFFAHTVVWMSIVFYYCHGREFTWEAMMGVLAQRRRERMYARAGLDVERMRRLQEEVRRIEAMLSKYSACDTQCAHTEKKSAQVKTHLF